MSSKNIAPRASARARVMIAASAIALVMVISSGPVEASRDADWAPRSSERLTKLPASYIKKSVDKDFANSSLALALGEANDQIALKGQTLQDLQGAIDRADGELRIDLQHQFLAEKQGYLKLVSGAQDLRRRRAETKIRVYERLLGKMKRSKWCSSIQVLRSRCRSQKLALPTP